MPQLAALATPVLVLLTALADRTSLSVSILVGAGVLALAAPLYLPALRAGYARQRAERSGARGQAGR